MPKNPRYRPPNNYYSNDACIWNDQQYNYENLYNYEQWNYEYYDYGRNNNNNYRNRRQGPYYVRERSYRQKNPKGQKSWNDQLAYKQKKNGHNQQPADRSKNKPSHIAIDKPLTAPNKEAVNAKNGNVKKCSQSIITEEKTVEEKKSTSPVLKNSNNQKQVEKKATLQPLQPLNFQFILEEKEQAFKTLKNDQKLEEQREKHSFDATTVRMSVDERTVKEVKLFQTREELVQSTKQTSLYKAFKEHINKNVSNESDPKTPDTTVATSRWKEQFYKPWKLDLVRFGYRFLDNLNWENDDV